MRKINNITFCILTVVFFSCNSPTVNKTTTEIKTTNLASLAGQVYFYAPELDTTTCKATGACDCCSGFFYFLNDSVFLSEDNCESSNTYSKGIFRFDNYNLILKADSLQVDQEYNWENETDTTGIVKPDFFIKQRKTAIYTQTLARYNCKDKICFTLGDKQKYFVTPDKDVKLSEIIGQLKKDSIWDKLEMK